MIGPHSDLTCWPWQNDCFSFSFKVESGSWKVYCQGVRWEVELPVPLTLIDRDCYNNCFITFIIRQITIFNRLKSDRKIKVGLVSRAHFEGGKWH